MKPVDQQIRAATARQQDEQLPEKCCGRCEHHVKNTGDITGRTVVCNRFPPTAFPVQQAGGIASGIVWPVLKRENKCGEFALEAPAIVGGDQ